MKKINENRTEDVMKKSMNKIKFLTVALALSVLVSSCDIASALNNLFDEIAGKDYFTSGFGGSGGGVPIDNLTEQQITAAQNNCKVQIYNTSGSVAETITDPRLSCFVANPTNSGSHAMTTDTATTDTTNTTDMPDMTMLGIAIVKSQKDFTPRFMVGNVNNSGSGFLVTFDAAGRPLDSKGVVFKEGNTNQEPDLIFLEATRNGWCFVKLKDTTRAYVVTFNNENVDAESPADATPCTYQTIFALAAAGAPAGGNDGTGGTHDTGGNGDTGGNHGTGDFVGNCTFITYDADGTPQPLPYKDECVVSGSTLTVYTSLATGKYKSALLNSDTGSSTFYNDDGSAIVENLPSGTIRKIVVVGNTWTISASVDGGNTFIKMSTYKIDN